MKFVNPFSVDFWIDYEPTEAELGFPKRGPEAVKQARYSAIAVEQDRDLYSDLMRQRREKQEELAKIDAQLEELDALRILETAT